MTRHGKNSTASAVYTYHEKKRDAATSGFGTLSKRLGKDSVKGFDCCCLTLQPCKEPVVTPDGYLYDREAILECLLHQKREVARKMKEYEKQKKRQSKELEELAEAEHRAKVEKFEKQERTLSSAPIDPFKKPTESGETISNMSSGKAKALPSFWVPSMTPQAKASQVEKPEKKTYCPTSGKPLKLKDLISIEFSLIDETDRSPLISKDARYKCAVTHDALSNSVPCAVLKSCGKVVTMDCVERLIRKDMLCPITGKTLKPDDILPLQRGGTGYSKVNDLKASTPKPAMQT
ncbi:nitric oxide synthase-interacting protein-like isoform X2 [Oscarella lobularis]|uniref:nitric oxide synthase-interacting protein-like isoform X2 n=1 Tax=Oscarella lobularis TaxID=121494 RepID=UPI003313220D